MREKTKREKVGKMSSKGVFVSLMAVIKAFLLAITKNTRLSLSIPASGLAAALKSVRTLEPRKYKVFSLALNFIKRLPSLKFKIMKKSSIKTNSYLYAWLKPTAFLLLLFATSGKGKIAPWKKRDITKGLIEKIRNNKDISEKEAVKLIEQKESDTLEFKQNIKRTKEITIALSSFANHRGGLVVVGIDDKKQSAHKKIVGADIGYQSIENLVNTITERTDPKLYPIVRVVKALSKELILVYVDESKDKPVSSNGRFFKRVGNVAKQMSRQEFERLLLERKDEDFDAKICEDAAYIDIDQDAVNRFREMYGEINKTTVKSPNKELLKTLGCIKEIKGKIKITNAGILLFGKEPKKFLPNSYVTVVRYPGKEKGSKYLDIKDFYGNLFDIIDSVNNYVKEHTQEISEVVEGEIARKVTPQYPYFAVRELITNAVVHRDYSIRGSRIIIRMFKDRMEFNSPGPLPGKVTPKNIVYEQYSRNPILADVLHRVNYIEELGEGWDKIIASIKEHPYRPRLPYIRDTGSTIIVALYSPEEMVEKELDKRIVGQLNERQRKALQHLKFKRRITRKEYMELTKCTEVTAKRDLQYLVKLKLLQRIGKTGKHVYYILNPNGSSNGSSNGSFDGALESDRGNEQKKQQSYEEVSTKNQKMPPKLSSNNAQKEVRQK